ncbi:EamA family transporter [Candidatus Saccharibacteria bacterium]|nr:EamA family transporter [Candidatus Saccharibacteria bacterium]
MNWLILVAITVIFDASRIFIDNYVSDVYFKKNGAVSQKFFYGFTYILMAIIILIATNFNLFQADYVGIGLVLLSGALVSIAGIPYYKALEIEDSTNLGIFMQLAPVLYLILGWFFLGDTFSPLQLVAFIIILAAPTLIVFTTKKRSRKVKIKAVFFAFIYVLIAVIGNLIFVKADASTLNFIDEVALLFLAKGITNLIIIYGRPKWRRRFHAVFKSNKKILRPLLTNTLIGAAKDFAYRGALITAPAVALASAATDSTTPIVIFFMGILLTLIWPKFGREKLDRKTVVVHLIATALVVTGIIILQV